MIEIKFQLNSIEEAHAVTGAVLDFVRALRSQQEAKGAAAGAPQVVPTFEGPAAPAVDTPTASTPAGTAGDPVAAAVPAAPEVITSRVDTVQVPAKRGRGRPPRGQSPFDEKSVITAVVPDAPQAPAGGNLFDSAAPAVAATVMPSVQPVQQAPAAVEPAIQPEVAAALSIAQRQALVKSIYEKQPGGPERAMALFQRHGIKRVSDLKPEQYADFDNAAARTLAGTYDPVAGE